MMKTGDAEEAKRLDGRSRMGQTYGTDSRPTLVVYNQSLWRIRGGGGIGELRMV